jgi:hypothetical protein
LYGDDLYFYQRGIEVDFYVMGIQLAVQVSYSLSDPETRNREVNALFKMAGQIEVRSMMIITKDEEETIETDGYSIRVIPAWKWLLERKAPIESGKRTAPNESGKRTAHSGTPIQSGEDGEGKTAPIQSGAKLTFA